MAWQPDIAVCISLTRRTDRRAALGDLTRKLGFLCVIKDALDGADLPVPDHWGNSSQAYACMVSHREVLQNFRGSSILVLEDDAVVLPNFRSALNALMIDIPAFWESIYLGGEHARPPVLLGPHVVRCVAPIRTLAYIVRGEAISTAISVAENAVRHWDLPLGQALAARNTCFAPSPFIIRPDDSKGDIPDSEPYRS